MWIFQIDIDWTLVVKLKAAVDIFQLLFVLDDQFVTASMIGNFLLCWLLIGSQLQKATDEKFQRLRGTVGTIASGNNGN